MKTIVLKVSFLCLMILSFSSFADKTVITTSTPVVLGEPVGDVYSYPGTVATTDYHYVTVGGKNRVCYAEPQASLASLDVMTVKVNVGGSPVTWNCYEFSDEFFTVSPAP